MPDEADLAPASRGMEILIAATALVLSIVALVLSRDIVLRMPSGGLGPRWWPTVLSSGSAVLSALLLAYAIVGPVPSREDAERANRQGWTRMASALALTFLYVLAWSQIGYIVPTAVYLLALLWLFGLRNPLPLVLYPVIVTTLIYGLFSLLLRVPL